MHIILQKKHAGAVQEAFFKFRYMDRRETNSVFEIMLLVLIIAVWWFLHLSFLIRLL